jgi:hypothetical protein
MADLADEDPILAMLQEELDDDSSLADVEEDVVDTPDTSDTPDTTGGDIVDGFSNFNMNLSENCQIIIIVLLLIILFKEEIMKNKFVKSILN